MAKLYIMCGLPFSGKSYTGKLIADKVGAQFLSYDKLWREYKEKLNEDKGWEELTSIAHQRIRETLERGESIVYDTLNDTVGNRKALRNLAAESASSAVTVYMDTPIEMIRERQQLNEIVGERHSVDETKFYEAMRRFEVPVEEENIITIKPDTDINTIF